MNAWSDLPNAQHIDWVLESLKANPELWGAAWRAARAEARNAGRAEARNAAWAEARLAARLAAEMAAYTAARVAAYTAALAAARSAARDAILALIAYDDCDQYLEMTADELKVWALVSERPAALLLVPMVVVREQMKELETV